MHAFEVLVNQYQKSVYRISYRYVGSEEDAKDVTQEVFVKIYKNLSNFKFESKFSTWIYQIASNTAIDFLRKRKETYSIDAEIEEKDGAMRAEVPDHNKEDRPEEVLERKEQMDEIQRAITKLSSEHREVLILRAYGELSYDEMSEVLGVSLGTVKSRLKRARENMKELYMKELHPNTKK